MATNYYNLPTLASVQGDIGDCLEDLLVEDSGNSGMETIDTTLHNHEQNINKLSGVVETFAVSSWTADGTIAPFTYKATVTLQTTLTNETIVELLNDDAVLFATYGFSIGSIASQVVTIYSVGQPSSSVSLSIRIGGVLSNSGGGGSTIHLYEHRITIGSEGTGLYSFLEFSFVSDSATPLADLTAVQNAIKSYTGGTFIGCHAFYINTTNNSTEIGGLVYTSSAQVRMGKLSDGTRTNRALSHFGIFNGDTVKQIV